MSLVRSITCKYLFYRFRHRDGAFHFIRLPMVHVRLRSRTGELDTAGLVDSGATQTLIPKELANILALGYDKGEDGTLLKFETQGAGGNFNSLIGHLNKLELLKDVSSFSTFTEMRVLVPENEGLLPYVVLGRDSVFKRFDITFEERRQKIIFRRI